MLGLSRRRNAEDRARVAREKRRKKERVRRTVRPTQRDMRAGPLTKTNVFITKNQEARRNLGPRASATKICEDAGHCTGRGWTIKGRDRNVFNSARRTKFRFTCSVSVC